MASWPAASPYFNHARYDGEWRRVQRVSGARTTVYVYGAEGELVAEYGTPEEAGGPGGRQYLTADHLGSTRVVTGATGAVVSRRDYFPFGEEIPATANKGKRTDVDSYNAVVDGRLLFTGKERDAESRLDYFGARYFSGAMGRFTSPDPLLNSGRPWEPKSWNRYAYTLNNPLKYTDPDGLFEWATACGPSDTVCLAKRTRFMNALGRLKATLSSKRLTNDDKAKLENVLSFYDDPDKKNGVFVDFGYAQGAVGLEWKDGDRVNVKLDLDLLDKGIDAWARADSRIQPETEFAAVVAHEGIHGRDVYMYGNNYLLVLGRVGAERSAFDAQSLVNKGYNALSPYGLWNPSWARIDTARQDRRRKAAVERNAEDAARKGQALQR